MRFRLFSCRAGSVTDTTETVPKRDRHTADIGYRHMAAPYERQVNEPMAAWHGFQCYRELGMERSYRKVAAAVSRTKRMVERWGSKWNWIERAAAWDAELDRWIRAASTAEILSMRFRHVGIAHALQEKALTALRRKVPSEFDAPTLLR